MTASERIIGTSLCAYLLLNCPIVCKVQGKLVAEAWMAGLPDQPRFRSHGMTGSRGGTTAQTVMSDIDYHVPALKIFLDRYRNTLDIVRSLADREIRPVPRAVHFLRSCFSSALVSNPS